MRWIKVWWTRWMALALLPAFALGRPAGALYLDEEQDWSLRARIYSQMSIRLQPSQGQTTPPTFPGQLVQHRNFYNPELDAKLTKYTSWMRGTFLEWIAPDELRGRAAAWGFYDGIYDYGSSQFHTAERQTNATFNDFTATPKRAWYLQGSSFNCPARRVGGLMQCIPAADQRFFGSVFDVYPGVQVKNARDIYANQQRINELYLSYSKGPRHASRYGPCAAV
jgi:hypothetical protein